MACIRVRKGGRKQWLSVHWRDYEGRKRSRSLRTTDMRIARIEKERVEREVEGRSDAPVAANAEDALEQFLSDLSLGSRLRNPSVDVYRRRLTPLFLDFSPVPMARWKRSMVKRYLAQHPDWQERTIQITVNACRRFHTWCREDANIECPDFVGRNRGLVPKVRPKTDHEVLALSEIAKLMKEVRGEPRANRWIDLAVNLAFWAALPIGDIRTLEWKHLDLQGRTLKKTREKTGELIVVPVALPLLRTLQRHRRISGLVVPYLPESSSSARKSLARKIHNAGLPKRPKGQGGWHIIRHSAATALDSVGARESSIRLILGHKGVSMTSHYIHADLQQAREAMERLEMAFAEARWELIRSRWEERHAKRQAG